MYAMQGNGVYRCRHWETPGKTRVKKNLDPTIDHVKRNRSKITALGCKARFYLRKITRCKCLDNVSEKFCLHQQTLFELRGCLKHSHEVEGKSHRISQVTKNLIMSLEVGVPRSVVRDKYCRPSHMEDLDAKWVTLKDLTNFENALHKSRHPPAPSASVPCAQLDLAISSMTDQVSANSKVNLPDKLDGLSFSINADPASLNLTSQDGKSGTGFSWLAQSGLDLLDSTST
ncbi:uncharacterized protein LOC131879864 [Tigriopus californicus]|uniref:uncharacterized protein LOC131879864 n=1 Tax=Tigriopus californicus TaxID=6832 RepID=UPI0027DA2781|nr:uncharacterized protein LOC131879864 [Tigriopus californicus]